MKSDPLRLPLLTAWRPTARVPCRPIPPIPATCCRYGLLKSAKAEDATLPEVCEWERFTGWSYERRLICLPRQRLWQGANALYPHRDQLPADRSPAGAHHRPAARPSMNGLSCAIRDARTRPTPTGTDGSGSTASIPPGYPTGRPLPLLHLFGARLSLRETARSTGSRLLRYGA